MLLGQKKSVTYEVGEDEAGAYVLPATFVGTWEDRGFEIDGSRAPVRLRLDKFPRPDSITLPAPRGAYLFKRKEFKVPAKPT